MKKGLAAFICICLLLVTLSAAADNDLTAVNVVVLEIEGTVEVSNQSGNAVPVFNNMKLHSGYEVTTGENSYAWMSLDDTKVAGLDSDSNMAVKKQGKQLVLLLDAGNMFFDVQEKLEKDEMMNVRTSNMVMGIHGTFCVIKAVSNDRTDVFCLDGITDIRTYNPVTGESREVHIVPGEFASFSINEQQTSSGSLDAEVRKYEPSEIDAFVLRYLNNQPETLDRIEVSGGGDLRDLSSEW